MHEAASKALTERTMEETGEEIAREARQELASFFEIEFKNCQRELL